ncbi:MAG: hypothetical protein ACRD8W_20975 [Nitrososphaeraceae archaeon]
MIGDIPQRTYYKNQKNQRMENKRKSKKKRTYKKMMIKVKCDINRLQKRLIIARTTIILLHSFYDVWSESLDSYLWGIVWYLP